MQPIRREVRGVGGHQSGAWRAATGVRRVAADPVGVRRDLASPCLARFRRQPVRGLQDILRSLIAPIDRAGGHIRQSRDQRDNLLQAILQIDRQIHDAADALQNFEFGHLAHAFSRHILGCQLFLSPCGGWYSISVFERAA